MRIPMRVGVGALLLLIALLAVPAGAQENAEGVRGTLTNQAGEPVEGVDITVRDAEGDVVDTATSDEEGAWSVPVPGPGSYEATLDTDTLPGELGLTDPERQTLSFTIRTGQNRTLIFQLGERETAAAQMFGRVAQSGVNGIKFGLIIAMTAIGLSLIFGTTGLINFAHGDLVTMGAVTAFVINTAVPGVHLIPATFLAVAVCAGFGGALEAGLFRPLRRRRTGLIQLLVITVGLAFLLRHVILFFFGGSRRTYLNYALQSAVEIGPVRLTPREIVVMALSLVVLIGVGLLLTKTRLGKAMRAVSDNRDLAESSGINVERIILVVWMLGAALAALGGIFQGVVVNVNYLMGFRLLLLMFAGVILGGLGTAYGAIVGSLVVGIVTELSTLWFPAELKYMWALLVLIVILLIRPQGILGRRERVG
ncbi:MAG TPA: branched-chain amino acid ABC transporter permease [Egibacteraceae bacterium]|nr:branched-chain amino acid ABC transporter permease [Egibacteraceae bacterium]